MPMARFWELGAGALIACVEAHRVKVPHPTLMGLVGLGGIAASVALLDGPETPTWMMLGPVAAAAAVILSGGAGEGPGARSVVGEDHGGDRACIGRPSSFGACVLPDRSTASSRS